MLQILFEVFFFFTLPLSLFSCHQFDRLDVVFFYFFKKIAVLGVPNTREHKLKL